ncbi:MAG: DUF455 family protein [Thermomicrobiales bacterium]
MPAFDVYASFPIAGELDVRQTATLIARYHYIEAQLMRVTAGKLAALPEWEAKCLLGRHLWQDALHANDFLDRLIDLRWPRKAPLHPGETILRLMALLDEAPTTATFLAGVYRVIKPGLVAAYTLHLSHAAPLADEPTCILLRQTFSVEQEHVREGAAMLESLAGSYEREATLAWQTRVEELWTGVGVLGGLGEEGGREVVGHFEGQGIGPAPVVAARDDRFRMADDGFGTATLAPDEAVRHMAHRDADNEMHAAEVLGRNLYEHPEMPWEYQVDMARQCWDEVRHAVLYQKYLEELSGRLGDYPVVPGNYAYRMALDFPHRLYDLHLRGEKLGMSDLIRMRKEARQTGDRSYALLNDYVHADEVPHVKNGRWLKWLLHEDEAAFRQVERETMRIRADYAQAHQDDPLLRAYTGLSPAILSKSEE